MPHRCVQKLCAYLVLCSIGIACIFYFKSAGPALDNSNERNTTVINAGDIKPLDYVPVEDLKCKYNVDALFPDFSISEVLINTEPFYRFDLSSSDTYLLVNAGQTELTIHGVNQTLSIPLYTHLFSSTISPAPTLSVVDLTGDGKEELLYIMSDGGTGAHYSVCRIFDLDKITEYSMTDIRQELNSDIQITPLKIRDGEVICEISLRQELPRYGKVQGTSGKTLRQYTPVLPNDSDCFDISLYENGELWLYVALSVRCSEQSQYLCKVGGDIVWDPNASVFRLGDERDCIVIDEVGEQSLHF